MLVATPRYYDKQKKKKNDPGHFYTLSDVKPLTVQQPCITEEESGGWLSEQSEQGHREDARTGPRARTPNLGPFPQNKQPEKEPRDRHTGRDKP